MAANNYYYEESQRPPAHDAPPQAPYYNSAYTPSPQSTPAPSYHSGYPAPGPSHAYGQRQQQTGPSPFDTVFDDNAYPMNSKSPTPAASTANFVPPNTYYDTSYQGPGGAARPHPEDIPLQDRPKDVDMNDHIYDAAGQPTRQKSHKVRFGELGMFGADRKRIPWVVYTFTIIQVAVFIAEIVRNGILTGSPIMIKPQFNPMIGPSTQVMINMGARYSPCMHNLEEIQGSTTDVYFLCPNATENTDVCPLSTLCGFGGVPDPLFNGDAKQSPQPNQWYRFIIPVFMHAGLIHIGFNMLLQMTLGKEMEMAIGPIRFFLVYISSGIFGNIMGGNYAAPGIASTGASGAIFGIIALTLLDLIYSWKDRRNPVKDLMFILLDIVISFGLGLLPGLDNFAHIGGFLMGLALGICVLHSPNSLRRRIGNDTPYSAVQAGDAGPAAFLKSPVGFFKGRKALWWAWWLVRAAALIGIIVVFIVLLNNFYKNHKTCSWCKYLSCIPVNNWCDIGMIQDGN